MPKNHGLRYRWEMWKRMISARRRVRKQFYDNQFMLTADGSVLHALVNERKTTLVA